MSAAFDAPPLILFLLSDIATFTGALRECSETFAG